MKKKIAAILLLASLVAAGIQAGEWDITVFRPGVNPRDKKDPMVQAKALYEKETGGKVTLLVGDWGSTTTKIIANLAAGTPIDVFWASAEMFPRYYTKGYAQPVDGWVNLKTPNLNLPVMDKYFKYDGKYYLASNKGSNHSRIIMFNKTMLEELGISPKEMPDYLYKNGKWTLAAMRDLAKKVTKDTDGDGKIDRWGVGGYEYDLFLFANGSTWTTIDSKGKYRLNFDDPRFLEAMTFLEQAYKEGWFQQDNNVAATGLQRRCLAMYVEGSWYTENIQKETKDEIVAVPYPLGPSNKEKTYPFMADGYCIGAGSKKQKAAGKYMDYCLKVWDDYDKAGVKNRAQYILDFLEEIRPNQVIVGQTTGVLEAVHPLVTGPIIWGGQNAKQTIEAVRPIAQAAVEDANEVPEVPVQLPFKEFKVDFEDGDISAFALEGAGKGEARLSLVSDKRAIEGTSLLVSLPGRKDGKETAVVTNADKLGVVGYRNYLISYSVKILKDPASPETAISLKVVQKNKLYGTGQKKLGTKDEVSAISETIRDVFRNGRFGLQFGVVDGVDLVIDNIKVKEVK